MNRIKVLNKYFMHAMILFFYKQKLPFHKRFQMLCIKNNVFGCDFHFKIFDIDQENISIHL